MQPPTSLSFSLHTEAVNPVTCPPPSPCYARWGFDYNAGKLSPGDPVTYCQRLVRCVLQAMDEAEAGLELPVQVQEADIDLRLSGLLRSCAGARV